MRPTAQNTSGINDQHLLKSLHTSLPKRLYEVRVLRAGIVSPSHIVTVLNGRFCAWRSILLMKSKLLSQIQMRCTQLWLVLEKHLSEQGLTEAFLNTRQSQCLTQRRERCAWTAEWKTGQRIMMVISSKPKQSRPLIPHSLSLPLFPLHPVSLSPKSSNTFHAPLRSQPHTNHILTWPFYFIYLFDIYIYYILLFFFLLCAWATI